MGDKKWIDMVSYITAAIAFLFIVIYIRLEWNSPLLCGVLASAMLLGLGIPQLRVLWKKGERQ